MKKTSHDAKNLKTDLETKFPKKLRAKKFKQSKDTKIAKWWSKLQEQYEQNLKTPKYHFQVLLSAVIICFLFLIFSSIILFSISFNYYTTGIAIPLNQFFNQYASSSQTITYHLRDFGLYDYSISIEPYRASSIASWIESNGSINLKAIMQILNGFNGPYLNGFGITYVVFQIAIILFIIIALIQFKKYNKFLKLTIEGRKIWHYFGSCYGLVLSAVIISSFITEINVIPGSDVIKPLLHTLLASSSSSSGGHSGSSTGASSGTSSKIASETSSYINKLTGSGLALPISAFGLVRISVISIDNNSYLHVSGLNSWWSWIVISLYLCYIIVLSTLMSLLSKFNLKHEQEVKALVG